MTVIMIVAIVVAVIFTVFCVLGIMAFQKGQKNFQEHSRRIDGIESKLGTIDELAKQNLEMFRKKDAGISNGPTEEIEHDEEIEPDKDKPKIEKQHENETLAIEEIDDEIDFEGIEIEEVDGEIDIESFIAQLAAADQPKNEIPETHAEPETPADAIQTAPAVPAASAAPTAHFQGYDIGRSGKKYTTSDLMKLIEE